MHNFKLKITINHFYVSLNYIHVPCKTLYVRTNNKNIEILSILVLKGMGINGNKDGSCNTFNIVVYK